MARPSKLLLTTLLWGLLVTIALLAPESAIDEIGGGWLDRLLGDLPWADKAAHVVLFAVFAWLVHRSVVAASQTARPAFNAFILSAGYGLLLDLLQAFIPGRTPEALDIVANVVGAAVGAVLASRLARR